MKQIFAEIFVVQILQYGARKCGKWHFSTSIFQILANFQFG
jgi:hypothetical protein